MRIGTWLQLSLLGLGASASGCEACGPADPCVSDPLGCAENPLDRLEPEADCPSARPTLAVTLGRRRGTFAPYGPSDALPYVYGSQGGGHVEIGVAVAGLALSPERLVRGLRAELLLDEAISCEYAGEGDFHPDDVSDDATGQGDAGQGAAGEGDAGTGEDSAEADGVDPAPLPCSRRVAQRVILLGAGGTPLPAGPEGTLELDDLVLFVDGFRPPSLPTRLSVALEDSCGREARAAHLFMTGPESEF